MSPRLPQPLWALSSDLPSCPVFLYISDLPRAPFSFFLKVYFPDVPSGSICGGRPLVTWKCLCWLWFQFGRTVHRLKMLFYCLLASTEKSVWKSHVRLVAISWFLIRLFSLLFLNTCCFIWCSEVFHFLCTEQAEESVGYYVKIISWELKGRRWKDNWPTKWQHHKGPYWNSDAEHDTCSLKKIFVRT